MPLEPDLVLPGQLGSLSSPRRPLQGARLLMLAVLQDAIECYRKRPREHDPAARLLFEETRAWMESTDHATFSFESICDALDIDADYLRRRLRQHGAPVQGGRRP